MPLTTENVWMNAHNAMAHARGKSYEDLPAPPMTWHKVRIRKNGPFFRYKTRAGEWAETQPDTIVEVDRIVLHAALKRGAEEVKG